jgi:hypothetical protein
LARVCCLAKRRRKLGYHVQALQTCIGVARISQVSKAGAILLGLDGMLLLYTPSQSLAVAMMPRRHQAR